MSKNKFNKIINNRILLMEEGFNIYDSNYLNSSISKKIYYNNSYKQYQNLIIIIFLLFLIIIVIIVYIIQKQINKKYYK